MRTAYRLRENEEEGGSEELAEARWCLCTLIRLCKVFLFEGLDLLRQSGVGTRLFVREEYLTDLFPYLLHATTSGYTRMWPATFRLRN